MRRIIILFVLAATHAGVAVVYFLGMALPTLLRAHARRDRRPVRITKAQRRGMEAALAAHEARIMAVGPTILTARQLEELHD